MNLVSNPREQFHHESLPVRNDTSARSLPVELGANKTLCRFSLVSQTWTSY